MSDVIVRVTPPSTEIIKIIVNEGVEGKSAYEVAVANGFVGTEAEWLLSLHNIPAGGTTGQVLSKNSNTDYDVEWSDPAGGSVDSVNGQTGAIVLDTSDISEATDKNYVTDAEKVILSNTSGSNSGDQDLSSYATKAYADALVVGLWDDRGNFDSSVNAYPSSGGSGTAGAIKKGDIWTVSVAGTLPTSQVVEVGDTVRALVDTPGNTQANWSIQQNNIGYTAENSANKSTNVNTDQASDTKYPSVKAVYDWATGLFQTLASFAADVRAVVLTGLSTATNAVITSSDSILSALGKLQKQITDLVTSGVEAAYAGTITWTAGTAPSGSSSLRQHYNKVGNLVTWQIELTYATAGSTITGISLTFPTEFPTPLIPSGFSGANMYLYPCQLRYSTAPDGTFLSNNTPAIERNSANTGFVIAPTGALTSGSYKTFIFSGFYFTA